VTGPRIIEVEIAAQGDRLDRALAADLPELSRVRIQALMRQGAVCLDQRTMNDPSATAEPGRYRLAIPPPTPATPAAEPLALTVLYEDADLIVVDKPAGMAVHPAPGSPAGTLVNALIHHCGESLSGIGGVARPGIVHRLDKLTSGVMVAAKTDLAHHRLSATFAAHDIEAIATVVADRQATRAGILVPGVHSNSAGN
jgi:23S rRNA pseudouridine1911/1915/1917 synthase